MNIFDYLSRNIVRQLNEMEDRLNKKLDIIQGKEKIIMADLTELTAQVKNNTDVEQSAIVLIKGLADQIAAAGTDPVALKALQDQLKTSADALAAAIIAGTV